MYKVFINEKVICFTNSVEKHNEHYNVLVLNFYSTSIVPSIIELLDKDEKTRTVIFEIDEPKAVFEEFQTYFKIIKAAGGIVSNSKSEKLFIFRLEKWDLPKGKIENDEGIEEAAIREVEEECGVNGLKIIKELNDTFHIYTLKNKLILKQTYWFEMESNYDGELIPQIEEDITKVEWLKDDQVNEKVLNNTYSSIRELLSLSGY